MGLLLLVVLAVIVVLFAMKPILSSSWGRRVIIARPMRSRLRRVADRGFVLTPVQDVPTELDATTRILESLGFVRVAVGRQTTGSALSILVRPPGEVIATADWRTRRLAGVPRTIVTLASAVPGRVGVFDTTNSGLDIEGWPWQIIQIFPHASVDELVRRHDEGLGLLEERGVRFEQVDGEGAIEVLAWVWRMSASSFIAASDEVLGKIPFSVVREAVPLGPRLGDPATMEQIEGFRAARPEP